MSGRVKKWGLVAGMAGGFAALVVVAVVAGGVLFAATTASAQESEPTPGPGDGARGWFGWGGGSWTVFDTIAEALGLTVGAVKSYLFRSIKKLQRELGVAPAPFEPGG